MSEAPAAQHRTEHSDLPVAPAEPAPSKWPIPTALWLILILILAAFLRFRAIGAGSLDDTELINLEASTGRGLAHVDLPENRWIDPPIELTTLRNAAPWSNLWTSPSTLPADSSPLFLTLLRGFRGIIDQSDGTARAASAVVSLVGIALLFIVVQMTHGSTPALLAALIMTLSGPQIAAAQYVGDDTTVVAISLATAAVVLAACRASSVRWLLPIALLGTILMLWVSRSMIPVAVALLLTVLVHARGRARPILFAAVSLPLMVTVALQLKSFALVDPSYDPGRAVTTLRHLAEVPLRAFTASRIRPEWVGLLSAAFYVVPLIFVRRRPTLLLWWTWLVSGALPLAISDALCGTQLLTDYGATLLIAPSIFALAATMLVDQRGWRAVAVPVLCAIACALALEQAYVRSTSDFRGTMQYLAGQISPEDAVVFYSEPDAAMARLLYLHFDHCTQITPKGAVVLSSPARSDVRDQLSTCKVVWVVSDTASFKTATLGLQPRTVEQRPFPGIAFIYRMELPSGMK